MHSLVVNMKKFSRKIRLTFPGAFGADRPIDEDETEFEKRKPRRQDFQSHAERTAARIASKHGLTLSDLRKTPTSAEQAERRKIAMVEVRQHFKFLTNDIFSKILKIRITPTRQARAVIAKR